LFLEVVVMESGKVLVDVFDLITLIPHFFGGGCRGIYVFLAHFVNNIY